MPKLCANLRWLFTETTFLERFDAAARAGFTAVEYPSPYDYSAGVLRARLRACGLEQILIIRPPEIPPTEAVRGWPPYPGDRRSFATG